MFTKEDLIQDIIRMGVRETDTLFVHSSYKHAAGDIGIVGGADTVVDAFIEYLAPKGLIVFPSMSWKLGYLVNDAGEYIPPWEGPKEGFHPYGNAFHVKTTPSDGLGIIPEVFRKRPGVIRSLSPTSSVCAMGADAAEFCAGHDQSPTPLNWDSPWGNLYRRGAKILFLGTTMACNTYMHAIEDYAALPGLLVPYEWQYTVEDYDGNVYPVHFKRHEPGHNHYYIKVQQELIDQGIAKVVRFGAAECHLVDAVREADYMLAKLKKEPWLFTHEFNLQKE